MNLIIFLISAIFLIGLSIAIILHTLLKTNNAEENVLEQQREADNIDNLKKQLTELENKLQAKAITQDEYDSYKLDAERRLLSSLQVPNIQSTKTPLVTIISTCVGLPIVAALLYIALGTPSALNKQKLVTVNSQTINQQQTIESALNAVNERLRIDPNDLEAKFALGNIYYASQDFTLARDTFKSIFEQQPDRPDVLLAYAEAQARTQNNFFKGVPLELINRTLQLVPDNKKANWLLGVAAFQEGKTENAIAIWQKQLDRTDNNSQERMMLERMIIQAGGKKPAVKKSDAEPPHLNIKVSISAKLTGQYKNTDTVFIYAKAAAGPPMPLAIYRTTVDKLPLSLTLTDADAMSPQMKLSMFNKVIAYARISKSGDAITQSGDLIGQSAVLDNTNQKISLEIDAVIP